MTGAAWIARRALTLARERPEPEVWAFFNELVILAPATPASPDLELPRER